MRRILNTNLNHEGIHLMLLVTRIATATLMLTHGYHKLQRLMEGEVQFGDPIGIGAPASLVLTVFSEVFCSVLILLGLVTRLAVIPLIITMLVVVLIVHAPDAFSKKELGLHFILVYLFLLIAGAGKYSLDHIISRNLGSRRR